ncbi:MAG: ABC transporter ATP-binding protein [Acidimicrobiales bacterium]
MSSDPARPGPAAGSPGDTVIVAEAVSKRYLLGEREQYMALRDVLAGGFRRGGSGPREELWALRDVSFSVAQGEVVGIIGRNGAGKSTLLKILSRITTPTEGQIRMRGRIGSLLEVGSGFHPELTGMENVFLNGAILGMTRAEIRAKLDEIVGFAEMEQFITTPVKHYSVGMFMRLAFAVAAHLDSEILIVDEVLAVGDARFQQKCLAKMGEVARSGRSVLFVSHNLEATQALCDRGLLLDHGSLALDGTATEVVEHYRKLAGVTTRSGDQLDLTDVNREGTGQARFTDIAVVAGGRSPAGRSMADGPGRPAGPELDLESPGRAIRAGDSLALTIGIDAKVPLDVASFGLTLSTEGGVLLLNLDSGDGGKPTVLAAGRNRIDAVIPRLHLAAGRYRLGLRLANPVTTRIGSGAIDMLDPALVIQVDDNPGPEIGDDRPEPALQTSHRIVQGAGSLIEGAMTIKTECR